MAASAGDDYSAAVSEGGDLFMWGRGECGQLGTGDIATRLAPTLVAGLLAPVRQVAAGDSHTGIVTEAGDLLMCGRGQFGRLGLGDPGDRTTPTLVERALFDDDAVLMAACGVHHTAVLTEGGGVYTFGRGALGRLGHGDEVDQLAPSRVPAAGFNGERVVMVAVGGAHTVALSEKGRVFTWGSGGCGQLGHNDRKVQLVPRRVHPKRFGGERIVFVAAGRQHTVAVTAGGRLYTWGWGSWGVLGHGDRGRRLVPTVVGAGAFGGSAVVMVACGGDHTLVVTHDGALWTCGKGWSWQLGLPTPPKKIPIDESDTEDEDWWKSVGFERLAFVRVGVEEFGGARVVAAAAGRSHSAAVTEDGALWTWGSDSRGELGHGDGQGRQVPARISGANFGGGRIGRCLGLSAQHALAFAMGTHGRLGGGGQAAAAAAGGARRSLRFQGKAASPIFSLNEELVWMIVRLCGAWPAGRAGEEEGVVRLLGGGAGAGRPMRAMPAKGSAGSIRECGEGVQRWRQR